MVATSTRVISSEDSNHLYADYTLCCDSDTDDSYLDKLFKTGKLSQNSATLTNTQIKTQVDFMPVTELSPQKPKSILIHHGNENTINKKSKSNRFVSFTLDDSKKPFTSSIYYGVKSYLHHFYEPVNKTFMNGDSFIVSK